MKRTTKTILLLVAAVIFSTVAFAQEPGGQTEGRDQRGRGGRMGNPQARLDRLSKELKLTDQQAAQIKPLLEDEGTKTKALRDASEGPSPEMFAKMRDIHQSTSTQIRALLNSDQQKKFDKMQKEEEQRRAQRMSGRNRGSGNNSGGPPPPDDGGNPPPPPQ